MELQESDLNGIVVAEAPGADHAIARLPTSTTAFIGRTLRGPVNHPVTVRSFAEFQQVFGGLWQPSPMPYAVEQYFENGGRRAVIVRVCNGGAPATITLPCGQGALTLEARSPGSREALRASVDYDNVGAQEEDRFNLVVQRVRSAGSEHIEDQEIFRRLSIVPGTARFVRPRCRNRRWCACAAMSRHFARTGPIVPARVTRSATSTRTRTATTASRSPTTT